jgi:hypothetical protein
MSSECALCLPFLLISISGHVVIRFALTCFPLTVDSNFQNCEPKVNLFLYKLIISSICSGNGKLTNSSLIFFAKIFVFYLLRLYNDLSLWQIVSSTKYPYSVRICNPKSTLMEETVKHHNSYSILLRFFN